MFATNYINLSMNAFIHPYLAFYVVFISLKTLFLSITSILIYILEVLWRSQLYTIFVLYLLPFLIIILITYSNYFMTYLFIFITHLFILLLVPHICFDCILCIAFF